MANATNDMLLRQWVRIAPPYVTEMFSFGLLIA